MSARFVRSSLTSHEPGSGYDFELEPRLGERVEVDLSVLIAEVLVNPLAPRWFGEVVQDAVRTSGLILPVSQSSLADAPTF